jgi:hypothetical protein
MRHRRAVRVRVEQGTLLQIMPNHWQGPTSEQVQM